MPAYFFWGDDDFALNQAVKDLQKTVLDPNWQQFNYEKIPGDTTDGIRQALNQALTPPFSMGGRLVWLADTTACQSSSEEILSQFQQTIPALLPNAHLLLSASKKPNGTLKLTKFLKKSVEMREFSLIPPWKTDEIIKRVRQMAKQLGVNLTPDAVELLAESVGNDTRQLCNELEKLKLYGHGQLGALDVDVIGELVNVNTQNSWQLAATIRQGKTAEALGLVADLLNRNEPALRIVATLVGQFRTWLMVKLQMEAGERDEKVIAAAAEIGNPKRVYFVRKEVQALSSEQLLETLPVLLELEYSLKRGSEAKAALQTAMVRLCQLLSLSGNRK